MELVKIATGEPITRSQLEAEWIAAQPETVMVPQTVSVPHIVDAEDDDGNPIKVTEYRDEIVEVEIPNHPEFSLPYDLTGVDLTEHGAAAVEPVNPPAAEPGTVVERDGVENVDGVWRQKWAVRDRTPAEFEAHERDLHLQIDAAAGAFRAMFITDVPGQQQTYAEKEAEARAWTPEADPVSFPFLAAEATARGAPIADVVALIIATADAWRLLGAAIEGARMGAKAGVTAARQDGDWAAMDLAAAVDWEALA